MNIRIFSVALYILFGAAIIGIFYYFINIFKLIGFKFFGEKAHGKVLEVKRNSSSEKIEFEVFIEYFYAMERYAGKAVDFMRNKKISLIEQVYSIGADVYIVVNRKKPDKFIFEDRIMPSVAHCVAMFWVCIIVTIVLIKVLFVGFNF